MTINYSADMSSRALMSKSFFIYATKSLEASEWDNENKIVEDVVDDAAY
jgi:hypothetical protein